jgi:hypothetical protein
MVSMGTQNKSPFLSLYLEFVYKRYLEAQYGKVWEQDYFIQLTRINNFGDIEYYKGG